MSAADQPAPVQTHPASAAGGAVNSDSSSPTTTSHTLTTANAPGLYSHNASAATAAAAATVMAPPEADASTGAGVNVNVNVNASSNVGIAVPTPAEKMPNIMVTNGHAKADSGVFSPRFSPSFSPPSAAFLLDSLDPKQRYVFLEPPPALPDGSLQLAKQMLDVLATQVSDRQQQRLRETGRANKRKRPGHEKPEVLKVRKLHVDGFDTDQIWQQARRIIVSTLNESDELLRTLEESQDAGESTDGEEDAGEDIPVEESDGLAGKKVRFDEGSFAMGSDAHDSTSASSSEQPSDADDDGLDEELEEEEDFEGFEDEEDQEEENSLEKEREEVEGANEDDDDDDDDQSVGEYKPDPDGLNDGFFSLEEFNKQTLWFEDQDARGDPNTDMASDDEGLDWHADPMAQPSGGSEQTSGKKKHEEDDDDMETDGEDGDTGAGGDDGNGPTFGDMDLDAPEGASDDGQDGDGTRDGGGGGGDPFGLDLTANDIFYKNFFAPPKRKAGAGKKKKNRHFPDHNDDSQPPPQPDAADMERAERDIRRDLFEDLSDHGSDSEDALSEASAGNPKSRRSTHERRQAKLGDEIRRLEAELVAERAWTMSGEAAAAERPVNSLLGEELDFEYSGKKVRVVTEEVTGSIEDLIKRRILAEEFDELLRRRPDTLASGSGSDDNGRRGLLAEVSDTKAKQSLAEIYEEDHIKKQAGGGDPSGDGDGGGGGYVSAADEKLQLEEAEIESMWRDVSGKLDALSSWHYRPRPAEPALNVVADVATVAMEDAQPTTAQGVGGVESMLAPQELYAPGADTAEKGEVVTGDGMPVAREEMSREDRARRRRRAKERIRKASGGDGQRQQKGDGGNKKSGKEDRKETMDQLKQGGVRVINRKGEVVGLDGKVVVAAAKGKATSGAYKL